MAKALSKKEAVKFLNLDEKISSQIKTFERIHNGIEESLIEVAEIRRIYNKIFCTITVYDDDFSSKTVYQDVLYSLENIKLL